MTMKVGEKATIKATPDYAYGAAGFPAWGTGDVGGEGSGLIVIGESGAEMARRGRDIVFPLMYPKSSHLYIHSLPTYIYIYIVFPLI